MASDEQKDAKSGSRRMTLASDKSKFTVNYRRNTRRVSLLSLCGVEPAAANGFSLDNVFTIRYLLTCVVFLQPGENLFHRFGEPVG